MQDNIECMDHGEGGLAYAPVVQGAPPHSALAPVPECFNKSGYVNKAVNTVWRLRLVFSPARRIGRVAIALCLGTLGAITMVPTAAEAAFPGANGLREAGHPGVSAETGTTGTSSSSRLARDHRRFS